VSGINESLSFFYFVNLSIVISLYTCHLCSSSMSSIISAEKIFCCRNSDPEPNPLFFSSRVVCATFDYLTQKHSAHANSCVMLLARTQVLDQTVNQDVCFYSTC